MKKISKNSKAQKGVDVDTKPIDNLVKEKSTARPEEYEEQRSMNIRMKEQPLQSSAKPEKNTNQK